MVTAKKVAKPELAMGQERQVEGHKGIYERRVKKGIQFRVRLRENGAKLTNTFDTLKEAVNWQADRRTAVNKGEPVNVEKVKALSLSAIFGEYLQDHENELSYAKTGRIRRLIKEIGATYLYQFKTKGFEKYIKAKLNQEIPTQPKTKKKHPLFNGYQEVVDGKLVRRKFKPSTVRKYYYDIKQMLEWHAKVHEYHFDSKPFDDVPAPASWEEPRERTLHDGELEKLLQACTMMYKNRQVLQMVILFQIYSCMRIGETLLMKWSDVHINKEKPEESYIFVPKKNQKIKNKKNAADRYVLFRPELIRLFEEIDAIKKHPSGRVFYQWKSSVTFGSRFKVVCKNAGSDGLTPHDLRHHGITWFFSNTTLTDIEISKHTGHIELDTLKRYANLRPQKTGAKLWTSVGALSQPQPPQQNEMPQLPKLQSVA